MELRCLYECTKKRSKKQMLLIIINTYRSMNCFCFMRKAITYITSVKARKTT